LQIDPAQPPWVRRNLAEALLEEGNADAACDNFEESLASDPWPLTAMVKFAYLLQKERRLDLVRRIYARGSELVAEDPDIMRARAHLCSLAGEQQEAEAAIRRAIMLYERVKGHNGSSLADMLGFLADLLAGVGRTKEALAAAEDAQRLNPTSARHRERVAHLLANGGEGAGAAARLSQTMEADLARERN
jgi:tetratricopeptide (TPR) repeat protein